MRVMITGGGTGGHTSPAVAIIEALRERDHQLLLQWAGRRGSIEERVSRSVHAPFRAVPAAGWPRHNRLRRPLVVLKMLAGTLRAFLLLLKFQPAVVVGVGGYVSLPVVWTAQRMGIPTVLHEQNKRLGMANRLLAPRAACVFLSYEDTLGAYPAEKALVTGNPVRAGFINPPSMVEARERLGLDPAIPVILVSGGSQGAQSINNAVAVMLPQLNAGELQLLWMTGKGGVKAATEAAGKAVCRVDVFPFIDDMVTACAAASLLISRAGASSAAEIAAMGKAAILIPYPHATDNHQEQNARAAETAGAATVLLDPDCTGENLLACIRGLLENPTRLDTMAKASLAMAKPAAADIIAEEIIQLVFGREQNAAE